MAPITLTLIWIFIACLPVVAICFLINARLDRKDAARTGPVFASVHGKPSAPKGGSVFDLVTFDPAEAEVERDLGRISRRLGPDHRVLYRPEASELLSGSRNSRRIEYAIIDRHGNIVAAIDAADREERKPDLFDLMMTRRRFDDDLIEINPRSSRRAFLDS